MTIIRAVAGASAAWLGWIIFLTSRPPWWEPTAGWCFACRFHVFSDPLYMAASLAGTFVGSLRDPITLVVLFLGAASGALGRKLWAATR